MSSKKHRKKIKRMHEPIKAYTVINTPTDAMQTLRDAFEWIRKQPKNYGLTPKR